MEGDMIMFMAYLLISTKIGSESAVLEALKKVEGVEEAHSLWGVYDIVARIKADTMDKLKFIISKIVGRNEDIHAKLTLFIREA
jgi:DNA-binding Lrp family transcriptional regulator